MAGYRIITDSTTDITPEMIEDLGVTVIPMFYAGKPDPPEYPWRRDAYTGLL